MTWREHLLLASPMIALVVIAFLMGQCDGERHKTPIEVECIPDIPGTCPC